MTGTNGALCSMPAGALPSRDLAILVVFVCAAAIPFLSQPFHMDDNFYLDMARNAQTKPLYPNDLQYTFMGESLRDMGSHSHPPLQTYLLAALISIVGEEGNPEPLYHAAALLFPVLGAVSFYFIAARWVQRPLWPALTLAACPLFLVMQHSMMADIPTLAYWLAAIACFLWAVDRESVGLQWVSALFQFAAMFTSYQSVALTPLFAFYLWRRRGRLSGWLCLLVPLLLMTGWLVLGYAHYHRFLLFDTVGYVRSRDATGLRALLQKFLAVVQYQGWLSICPIFLFYLWGRGWRWRSLWLTALTAAFVAQLVTPDYRLTDKVIFVVGAVAGTCVLLRCLRWAACLVSLGPVRRDTATENQFLTLWYFGVFAYCLLLFTEGSARYVLPMIPPVVVLFFRDLEEREVTEYRQERRFLLNSGMVASGSLVLSLAWGMALSHADLEFARIYRRAAQDFSRISGGMVCWFGGEWGFRYYFSRLGARQLRGDEREVRGGDWVVLPRLALPYNPPPPLKSMMSPVLTLGYEPRTPIRLLDRQSPAGFYSTGWGLVPFSLSRKTLEEIEVSQVDLFVEALPRARVRLPAGGTMPFPTICDMNGTRLLSLSGSGTPVRLGYSIGGKVPLRFDVQCGVHGSGDPRSSVIFSIRHADDHGRILDQSAIRVSPGGDSRDRGWRPLALQIRASGESGNAWVELAVESDPPESCSTWCVGGAVLRPGGDH